MTLILAASAGQLRGVLASTQTFAVAFVRSGTIQLVPPEYPCGDGILDAGEECDDGMANGTAGDCCTATCQFAPAGAPCAGGTCDGLGECTAPAITTTTMQPTTTSSTSNPSSSTTSMTSSSTTTEPTTTTTLPTAAKSNCTATELGAAGKKAAAKVRCHAKEVAKGDASGLLACLTKAETKFDAAYGNAMAAGDCINATDAATVEAKVDDFVNDLDATLTP